MVTLNYKICLNNRLPALVSKCTHSYKTHKQNVPKWDLILCNRLCGSSKRNLHVQIVTWRLLMSGKSGHFDRWSDRWSWEQFGCTAVGFGRPERESGTRDMASVFNWKKWQSKNYLLNQNVVHNKLPIEFLVSLILNELNPTHYTAKNIK